MEVARIFLCLVGPLYGANFQKEIPGLFFPALSLAFLEFLEFFSASVPTKSFMYQPFLQPFKNYLQFISPNTLSILH